MDYRVITILAAEAVIAWFLNLKICGEKKRVIKILFAFLTAAAFYARYLMLDYETLDYLNFLTRWVDFFRVNGGFRALKYSVGNYNIPYLYFMALFSYSSVRDLYLIKLLTIAFDVLLAYSTALLVKKSGGSGGRSSACFFIVLFLPTVMLNGALWGQCDSIYVSTAVLGIALALDDRPIASMIAAAVSFSFKLQAVFILPVFAILWFRGKIKFRHFFIFPITYVIIILPAVLLGRPFMDTLTLYFSQTGSIGSALNYNSPSFFAIFDGYGGFPVIKDTETAARLGILAAFISMSAVIILCLLRKKHLNHKSIVLAAVLIATVIPYFLPHMHDRYFFGADVLSVVAAVVFPELTGCVLMIQFASLLGYHAYLKMRYLLMMRFGAYFIFLAIVIYSVFLVINLFHTPGKKSRIQPFINS